MAINMKMQKWNPLGYKALYRELLKRRLARQEELLRDQNL